MNERAVKGLELAAEMFSSRVSAAGLARNLSATVPHTAPIGGVSPYVVEKRNFVSKKAVPFTSAPVEAERGIVSCGVSATVNTFSK